MFKLKNTVKIESAGKTQTAFNTVLDFKTYIHSNTPYAKYILAGTDGRMFCEAAKLSFINADVLKGALYAEYCAVFEKESYNGESFAVCGLSADGINLCNRAQFASVVVKEASESVNVCVTVCLTGENGAAPNLCGGENPLALLFLGASAVKTEANCFSTDFNCADTRFTDAFALQDLGPAGVTFGPAGITMAANVQKFEFDSVFILGGKPVIREVLSGGIQTQSVTGVPGEEKIVNIEGKNIVSLNAVIQGTGIADAVLKHNFDRVVKTKGLVSQRTGTQAQIKTDVWHSCAAFKNGSSTDFYVLEKGLPKLSYTLEGDFEFFEVCAGGYLAVYGGGTLDIYNQSGVKTFGGAVQLSEKSVIVNEGQSFHIAAVIDKKVVRYRLSNKVLSPLTSYTFTDNAEIFRSFFSIGIAGKNIGWLLTSGTAKSSAFLSSLYSLSYGQIKSIVFGDSIAYLKTASGDYTAIITKEEITSAQTAGECIIKGDVMLIKNGAASRLYLYNRGRKTLESVDGGIEGEDIREFCVLGDYALALDGGGRIETYYCNRNGAFVYSPSFSQTGTATVVCQALRKKAATVSAFVKCIVISSN